MTAAWGNRIFIPYFPPPMRLEIIACNSDRMSWGSKWCGAFIVTVCTLLSTEVGTVLVGVVKSCNL